MRIAFLTPEYVTESNFDGGLANYLRRVAIALKNNGHDVEIFTSSDVREKIVHEGIVVHRITHDNALCRFLKKRFNNKLNITVDIIFRSHYLRKRFHAEHEKNKFDIAQASSFWAPGLLIAKSNKVDVVTRISGFEPVVRAACGIPCRLDNALAEWLELVQMRYSKAVYSPSALLVRTIQQYEPIQIDILRPPFELPRLVWDDTFYASRLAGTKYLLFFGTICRLKGIELIWQNLSTILSDSPDIHFVFIGKGELPPFTDDLTSFRDRIHHYGPIQHAQLFPIIGNAKAVILPSIIDNMPNACIESMVLEKVVVGTRGGSFDEIIEDSESGYLVDYNNHDEFRAVISKICQSTDEDLRRIGMNARSSVLAKLDATRNIKELEAYFNQAAKSKTGQL